MISRTEMLNQAQKAIKSRTFFSVFPEHHKAYPEEWMISGEEKFNAHLGKYFKEIDFDKSAIWIGEEVSPVHQQKLEIKYPTHPAEVLIKNADECRKSFKNTSIDDRLNVCLNALDRMKERFFEIAHATMHTTGQTFMMAFQSSGPHAADRALEAIAMAHLELTRYQNSVLWEKPVGKTSVQLNKWFTPVPKGCALVIGCATFPVWNTVPAIFANLMCGNPVIVKPHAKAVLPIAIVVAEIQKSLQAAGLSKQYIQMAFDIATSPITLTFAEHEKIKVIDYTGNTDFGNIIESLPGKTVFTEKSAINPVLIHSSKNLEESLQNLAFSILLYSGQMCTSPQNIYISEKGVKTPERTISYNEVVKMLQKALAEIIENPKIGEGTLGYIQNPKQLVETNNNFNQSSNNILMSGKPINGKKQTLTPIMAEVSSKNQSIINQELFGPFVKVIKTIGLDESIALAKETALKKGTITLLAFCIEEDLKLKIKHEFEEVFTPVSFNLRGNFWVNQHAAFSDFHVSGGNASGNATFTDANFINRRYVWLGHREMP